MLPDHVFNLPIPRFHGDPITDSKRPSSFKLNDISPFHAQLDPFITDHSNRSNIPETARKLMLRWSIPPTITKTHVFSHNIPIPHIRVSDFSRGKNVRPVKILSPRDVSAYFTIHHGSHFPVNPYCPTPLCQPVSSTKATN